VAVDEGGDTLLYTDKGWTHPAADGAPKGGFFSSVSCPSAGYCVGIAWFAPKKGQIDSLAASFDGDWVDPQTLILQRAS
jgi:hypothetical protein